MVIRDPGHVVRTAVMTLHCDGIFGKVWEGLFNKRHGIVPDLMHSSKWHNLVVAIQEDNVRAVAIPGVAQPLARVMRNVTFAKQRFDSTVGPVGKIALMCLPLATLLAYIASDRRNEKEQRYRATKLLQQMDSKLCTAIGVSADWGIICNWFLRLFDVAFHDIATSRAQIDSMIEALDVVFLEGRVFGYFLIAAPGAGSGRDVVAKEEPFFRVFAWTPPRMELVSSRPEWRGTFVAALCSTRVACPCFLGASLW